MPASFHDPACGMIEYSKTCVSRALRPRGRQRPPAVSLAGQEVGTRKPPDAAQQGQGDDGVARVVLDDLVLRQPAVGNGQPALPGSRRSRSSSAGSSRAARPSRRTRRGRAERPGGRRRRRSLRAAEARRRSQGEKDAQPVVFRGVRRRRSSRRCAGTPRHREIRDSIAISTRSRGPALPVRRKARRGAAATPRTTSVWYGAAPLRRRRTTLAGSRETFWSLRGPGVRVLVSRITAVLEDVKALVRQARPLVLHAQGGIRLLEGDLEELVLDPPGLRRRPAAVP